MCRRIKNIRLNYVQNRTDSKWQKLIEIVKKVKHKCGERNTIMNNKK